MGIVTISKWEAKCDGKSCCRAIESTTSMKKRSDFMSYVFSFGWVISKGKYLCHECYYDEVGARYGNVDAKEKP